MQMLSGNTIKLGDPTPIRDLLYIDDHVNAYLSCLGNDKAIGEVFNFCTGQGITILELVDSLKDITAIQEEVVWNTIPKRPLDIQVLIGDHTKATRILGWRPKVKLEEGLSIIADYWRKKLNYA